MSRQEPPVSFFFFFLLGEPSQARLLPVGAGAQRRDPTEKRIRDCTKKGSQRFFLDYQKGCFFVLFGRGDADHADDDAVAPPFFQMLFLDARHQSKATRAVLLLFFYSSSRGAAKKGGAKKRGRDTRVALKKKRRQTPHLSAPSSLFSSIFFASVYVMAMIFVMALLLAVAAICVAARSRRERDDGRRLPPTLPGAHPLWGHAGSLLHPIESLHQRLGPLARDHPGAVTLRVCPAWLPMWLSPPIVMLNDPALVREAFSAANGAALAHEPEIMENVQTVMGRGLLGIDGPAWQARRGYVLSTFFSLKALGAAAHVVDRHSARAVAILESRADPMAPVDLYARHLVPLMLAIIVELICGVDVAADHDGTDTDTPVPRSLAHDMGLVFDEVNDRTFRLFRTLRPTSPAYRAAFARAQSYIDGIVRQRTEGGVPSGRHDLISTLVAGHDTDSTGDVGADARRAARNPYACKEDVRAEAILFMFAGFESTSSTLAYAIHLLAHHSDVQERVRAEAAQWRRASAGAHDALNAMPLAEAVLREAMRIHPIAHMLTRRMARDLPLGEAHVVPAGARLLINNLGMSNAERSWDDPAAFCPERWMAPHAAETKDNDGARDAATAAPDQYASLPFGAGRRSCPGRRLAVLEMKLILAALLARFRFAPDPQHPHMERRVAFVMRPHAYSVLCMPLDETSS